MDPQTARGLRKNLQKLKRFLLARDTELIDQGVELAASLAEPAIFDRLLEGVTYDPNWRRSDRGPIPSMRLGGMFRATGVFEVSKPAMVYRDRALLGLLAHAPDGCSIAAKLKRDVTGFELDGSSANRLTPLRRRGPRGRSRRRRRVRWTTAR